MSAEARFSLPITKHFTPSGGTEDLAVDFNRELNSTVFPDLQRVEAAFRLPAGSATFGRSVVDFERHIQIYTVQAAYGLTDRLSARGARPLLAPEDRGEGDPRYPHGHRGLQSGGARRRRPAGGPRDTAGDDRGYPGLR